MNLAGVRVLARAIFKNRALLVPHLRVKSIAHLDFHKLRNQAGIKYVVFDKDNTLTLPYERSVHPSIEEAFTSCVSEFGPQNVAILSNSVGSKDDPGFKEAILIESIMKVPVIRHPTRKKPDVREDIEAHFEGRAEKSEIAMVGDRRMTDTLMGNELGYLTIEVDPFSTEKENFMVKMMRMVERGVIPWVAAKEPP